VTRPIQLRSSPSALVVLLQLIPEKEKPQSFIWQVWVSSPSLSFSAPPRPPPSSLLGSDNPVIIPSSPRLQPPTSPPHFCSALRPLLSPLPFSLSHYELYYFDPGPSICFNWIMICNHVLSGESIKRAGSSAPLLRGLLLFPHSPRPPHIWSKCSFQLSGPH